MTQKRAALNKVRKDSIDYLMRQFKKALKDKDQTKAGEWAQKLIKQIDKAAKKNIYHDNKAARVKSRMMKKIKGMSASK